VSPHWRGRKEYMVTGGDTSLSHPQPIDIVNKQYLVLMEFEFYIFSIGI
jgi:hypothetical protein